MYLLLSHIVSLLHTLSELCFSYSLLYRHLVKASCFFSFQNLINLAALGLSCSTWDLLFLQTSNCGMWAELLCSMQDLSSPTRDWTHIPWTARQILNPGPPGNPFVYFFWNKYFISNDSRISKNIEGIMWKVKCPSSKLPSSLPRGHPFVVVFHCHNNVV